MFMQIIKSLLYFVVLLFCACSSMQGSDDQELQKIRGILPPNVQIVERNVYRKEYVDRVDNGGAFNNARFVEVYGRIGAIGPEYRFFNVQPESIYASLGIENADVLVAANGYFVPSREVFWQYLILLKNEKKAEIELVRNGQPLLMKINFIN